MNAKRTCLQVLPYRDGCRRPAAAEFVPQAQVARDAHDPFGEGGGGLFATHPHIEERLDRAGATTTASFLEENVFQGVTDNGELVATLRFDVQRLFQNELDVIATLSTTPELSEEDDVNTINVRVAGATDSTARANRRKDLSER